MKSNGPILLLIAFPFIALSARAELKVSSFFGDHMVLQREQEVPIWGTATPGEKVTVLFRTTSVTARTGEDGTWKLRLPEQSVGKPSTLHIKSGDQSVVFEDVLVGEVWICSGQSNMKWSVEKAADSEAEIAAADYPSIRLFDIPHNYSPTPVDEIHATWQVCSPETVPSFSAVGYYFGRKLWKDLQVPIGLVSSGWGGTPAESWTPLETLKSRPDYKEIVAQYKEWTERLNSDPNLETEMQSAFDLFIKQSHALSDAPPAPDERWFTPNESFEGMQPVEPNTPFLPDTDGLVHVRKVFMLDEAQANRRGARALLGQIDNFDVAWINGVKIGSTLRNAGETLTVFRDYAIPDGTLKAGKNVLLIQIVDIRRVAAFGMNIQQPQITWPKRDPLRLPDGWKMKLVTDLGPRPGTLEGKMKDMGSYLWNGMIEPLIPAAFRGVIWYQGESNATRAAQYRTLFPDMIQAWRRHWNRGDFPFYFVQLANIENRIGWPELREAQREALALPNTGMAVIIDIGDPDSVHPTNKQDVGQRLALWALAKDYGITEPSGWLGTLPGIGSFFQQPIPYSGPLFREAKVEEGQIRLRFDHVNGGLQTRDGGELTGFTIAEKDGPFQPAEARIENNELIVSHPEIKSPAAVRYAWDENPEANLINGARLLASPFRTDDRPFTTEE